MNNAAYIWENIGRRKSGLSKSEALEYFETQMLAI